MAEQGNKQEASLTDAARGLFAIAFTVGKIGFGIGLTFDGLFNPANDLIAKTFKIPFGTGLAIEGGYDLIKMISRL